MIPGQLTQHPAPLNPSTTMQYAGHPPQPMNPPPGYSMQPPQQPLGHLPPALGQQTQYRNPAVEVEAANRNKAQLIVGIDFGTTFSGVAFAFATNNEAREDIITEWPGAGTHTKQKVCPLLFLFLCGNNPFLHQPSPVYPQQRKERCLSWEPGSLVRSPVHRSRFRPSSTMTSTRKWSAGAQISPRRLRPQDIPNQACKRWNGSSYN